MSEAREEPPVWATVSREEYAAHRRELREESAVMWRAATRGILAGFVAVAAWAFSTHLRPVETAEVVSSAVILTALVVSSLLFVMDTSRAASTAAARQWGSAFILTIWSMAVTGTTAGLLLWAWIAAVSQW